MKLNEYIALKNEAAEVAEMLRDASVNVFASVSRIVLGDGPKAGRELGFHVNINFRGMYQSWRCDVLLDDDFSEATAKLEGVLDEAQAKRIAVRPQRKKIEDYAVTAPRQEWKADCEIAADGYTPYSRRGWR